MNKLRSTFVAFIIAMVASASMSALNLAQAATAEDLD